MTTILEKPLFSMLRRPLEFNDEQLKNFFINAFNSLHDIFDAKNSEYYNLTRKEVENQKNEDSDFLLNLLDNYSGAIKAILKNPFKENAIENLEKIICVLEYGNLEDRWLDDQLTPMLENINLPILNNYIQFILVFAKHIELYYRLHFENLNRKYYFRFPILIREKYGTSVINSDMTTLDDEIVEICKNFCKELWEYGVKNNEKNN